MAKSLRFTCTKLDTATMKGALKPDEHGYYRINIGAFDAYNTSGEFYPLSPAEVQFGANAPLMRRVKSGSLKGEMGHPKRMPGMTDAEFAARLAQVWEENVSHHFRSIDLVPSKDKKGRPYTLVVAELKPAGPHGPSLKESLENPHENIGFSIRTPVSDKYVGITKHRHIGTPVTWDTVIEPGLPTSNKFDTVALESMEELSVPEVLLYDGTVVSNLGHALESAGIDFRGMLSNDRDNQVEKGAPASSRW